MPVRPIQRTQLSCMKASVRSSKCDGVWYRSGGASRSRNCVSRPSIDNNAARDLCLPEKRMRLTAHRDLKSLAVRKLHELRDVLRIAGPEYGDRLVVDHVSKVISRPLQCGIIEEQLAAESLQIIP